MKFLELLIQNLVKPTPVPSRGGELLNKLRGLRACSTKPWPSIGMTMGLIFSITLLIQPSVSSAQDFAQTINKTAEFANLSDAGNKFIIKNINGSVSIEAYDGNTIELTVNQEISGNSSEVEQGKQELEYKLERRGNLIFAYLDAPFITVDFENGKLNYCINRQDDDYQFTHDVTVRVPRNILMEGSTINKGMVSITGNFREVNADNVNGDVELKHMTSKTKANTVNGDITITYDEAPDQDSEYHTVNGTIEIYMPADLSADVFFKSMHGDLYTDFDNVTRLTPQVDKETDSHGSAITYRLDKFSPLRIGNGGTKLRFEVLNGDVYIRKQS